MHALAKKQLIKICRQPANHKTIQADVYWRMHNPIPLIKPLYLLFETSTHPFRFSFNTSFTAPAEHLAPCVLSIWWYSPQWTVGIWRTEPVIDIYPSHRYHLYPEAFYIFHSVLVGEIITVGPLQLHTQFCRYLSTSSMYERKSL